MFSIHSLLRRQNKREELTAQVGAPYVEGQWVSTTPAFTPTGPCAGSLGPGDKSSPRSRQSVRWLDHNLNKLLP